MELYQVLLFFCSVSFVINPCHVDHIWRDMNFQIDGILHSFLVEGQ